MEGIWNDTVVPFVFFSAGGTLGKGQRFLFFIFLSGPALKTM
jgi:hypothetical protein